MSNFIQKKSIQTENGDIFYFLDNYFPGKPTLVFIHGLSSNHTTWLNAMKVMREHGYNSLALDLRGHGHSDKTRNKNLYKLDFFSEDLDKIIRKEKINPIFVGYSFGGTIAIDYAIKHQELVRGLVLISTNHADPLKYNGIGFLSPIGKAFVNLLAFFLWWQKRKEYHYYRHGESVGYWHSVWNGLRTMPVSVNLWLLTQTVSFDFRKDIYKIKCPVIMIYSGNDPFATEAEMGEIRKNIPNVKIILSKNPSHFVATDSQDEVVEIVLDFLKEQKNVSHT